MALLDWYLRRKGKTTSMRDWLFRNKAPIGIVFGTAAMYINYNCPGLDYQACEQVKSVLSHIGAFLVGAGVLPSDFRERFTQMLDTPPTTKK